MSRPYNGFSVKERQLGSKAQNWAKKDGIVFGTVCEMCGQEQGVVVPHAEDYDRCISDAHPMCVHCHMSLHNRFDNPSRWLWLVRMVTSSNYRSEPWWDFQAYFRAEPYFKKYPEVTPLAEEEKKHWWQHLAMEEIDLRKLPEEEQMKITHPRNPEVDEKYSLAVVGEIANSRRRKRHTPTEKNDPQLRLL